MDFTISPRLKTNTYTQAGHVQPTCLFMALYVWPDEEKRSRRSPRNRARRPRLVLSGAPTVSAPEPTRLAA